MSAWLSPETAAHLGEPTPSKSKDDDVERVALIPLLEALASDCDNTDGWQDATPTIRAAIAALSSNKEDEVTALRDAAELAACYFEEGGKLGRVVPTIILTQLRKALAMRGLRP